MSNYINVDDINNKEDLLKKLKEAIGIRNQMGGVLYWNIVNDDCIEIARKCMSFGCSYEEVNSTIQNS